MGIRSVVVALLVALGGADNGCAQCRSCITRFQEAGCNPNGGVPKGCIKCVKCLASHATCEAKAEPAVPKGEDKPASSGLGKCEDCQSCIERFEAGGCRSAGGVPKGCIKCVQCLANHASCAGKAASSSQAPAEPARQLDKKTCKIEGCFHPTALMVQVASVEAMKGRALLTDLSGRKYVLDLSRGGVAKKLQSIVAGDEDGTFSSGVSMKGMLNPGTAKFSNGKDKKRQPIQSKEGTSTKAEVDKCTTTSLQSLYHNTIRLIILEWVLSM